MQGGFTLGRSLRDLAVLLRDTVSAWLDDYAPSMGAALAYYTVFSVAPLLLIVISVAGIVFGDEAARGAVVGQIGGLVGDEGAKAIEAMLVSLRNPEKSTATALLSTLTLLVGATTVFAELQGALDRIWRVPERKKPSGVWELLRARILSFGMILGIGFLLIVSLVASAAVAAIGRYWSPMLGEDEVFAHLIDMVLSFAMVTVVFAMIYKIMPHAAVRWPDVWLGAFVTSILFTIGKLLIGLYIGKAGVATGYGAAGSLVVVLVWVYYSAQIFLLGAEFTWLYANRFGSLRAKHGTQGRAPVRHA
ncbi:YihY/virulence factor BrkB family protein [Cupriavidus basilensis]